MTKPELKAVSTNDLLAELSDPARKPGGLILGGGTGKFAPALTLGQGLPTEIEGQPVKYWWKEVLVPGRYIDADKKPFEITDQRIDMLADNFKKAKTNGYKPYVPSHHTDDSRANFGFILDTRKNDHGGLELLHQIIGEDGFKAIARNESSIFTVYNYEDEHGNKYDEMIDHNALCPNSRLNNLTGFQPALAASRGTAIAARVLTLAAPLQRSPDMDLTKLRETIGAAKEVTDDDVIAQAIAKLTEGKTALALSNTAKTDLNGQITALTTRATEAETKLAASEGKVLQLSRTPDETVMKDYLQIGTEKIALCLSQGLILKPQADILTAALKEGEKPAALMLSRTGPAGSSPLDLTLKVLALNKPFAGNNSIGQVVVDPATADAKDVAKAVVNKVLGNKYPDPTRATAAAAK